MPNRCTNTLHVQTKKETDLSKYFIVDGDKISINLNKVVPVYKETNPEEYQTLIDSSTDWYPQACSKR